jgi:hypothetical protein
MTLESTGFVFVMRDRPEPLQSAKATCGEGPAKDRVGFDWTRPFRSGLVY